MSLLKEREVHWPQESGLANNIASPLFPLTLCHLFRKDDLPSNDLSYVHIP